MRKRTTAILFCVLLTIIGGMAGCKKTQKIITSFADAEEARIGVMTGSTGEQLALQRFPNAEIKSFDEIMDAVTSLQSNQIDAVVTAYPTVINVSKHNPDLWFLPEAVANEKTAIAMRKGEDELLAQVNDILTELENDGTLEDMRRRWFKMETTPYEEVTISLPESGTALRVGVNASREPFSFIDENQKVSGHDGELAYRIAAAMNRPLEFVDMNFSALIPALKSGKIDMIITGMTATDERRKTVDFSRSYFDNAQMLLVKRAEAVQSNQEKGITAVMEGIAQSFYNNIILENRYLLILDGMKTTAIISFFSALFGTLLGGIICFLRMCRCRALNAVAGAYISVLRGTPVLVLLMLIFYVVFAAVNISPVLVSAITFGMNFSAYIAEVYRVGIEGVGKGQTEAGMAMGFTKARTFFYIVLPQAVRQILPVYKGEIISLTKATSIVGYIAVQDITKAGDMIRSRTFDAFFPLIMVAILYLAISGLLLQTIGYIERKNDPKAKRKQVKKRYDPC